MSRWSRNRFMYRFIRQHPGTRTLYAQRLAAEGVIQPDEAETMITDYRKAMEEGRNSIQPALEMKESNIAMDWAQFKPDVTWDVAVNTAVPLERLQKLAVPLTTVPENFTLHSRVQKIVEDRIAMARGDLPLDWGWQKIWLMPRCSLKAIRCGCQDRTAGAARSSIAMPPGMTRTARNGTRVRILRCSILHPANLISW